MISPQAVIDPGARIAPGVEIGPFSVIGPDVRIGAGCRIGPHVVIRGPTTLGRDNRVFQFASLGEDPQDKKYGGEATELVIGDGNTIREFVTINRGTVQDAGATRLGDDNWIMAYVHIAHDCQVGSHTIFANGASLAGHVRVEDFVILGGFTLVHQFCALGIHSFTAYGSHISRDVPPFVTVGGQPAHPHGLNSEGLRRRGFGSEAIRALKQAYRTLYRSGHTLAEALPLLREQAAASAEVATLVRFLEGRQRGIIR